MPDAAHATELPTVRILREKLDESAAAQHFCVTLLGLSCAALERLRRVLDIPIARFTELIWIPPGGAGTAPAAS